MSEALQIINNNTAVTNNTAQIEFTKDQVELIKSVVAKDATDDELKIFLYTAKRTGLDPLAKQIHFVKRKGQMAIQTAIDGYRVIADRTGQLAGIDDAVYDTEEDLNPNKASVTVYKMIGGQKCSFTATARWLEYFPGDAQGFMWKKMPYLMLAKCAEALALRKAFPADLSGIYTNDEMAQADDTETPSQTKPAYQKKTSISVKADFNCDECGGGISAAIHGYSCKALGRGLCMECQKIEKAKPIEFDDIYEGTPFPTK